MSVSRLLVLAEMLRADGPHQRADIPPAPSCDGNCPIGGEGQPSQFGKRSRACPFHDLGAMTFDGALADAEIRGDILAGMAREHPVHDVMLPSGKASEALVGSFAQPEHLQDQLISFAGDVAIPTHRRGRPSNVHLRKDVAGHFFGVRS